MSPTVGGRDGRQEDSSLGNKLGFDLVFANFNSQSCRHKRPMVWISFMFPISSH